MHTLEGINKQFMTPMKCTYYMEISVITFMAEWCHVGKKRQKKFSSEVRSWNDSQSVGLT